MNTGNFFSSLEIFIISPLLFFGHTPPYMHAATHQACQTKTFENTTSCGEVDVRSDRQYLPSLRNFVPYDVCEPSRGRYFWATFAVLRARDSKADLSLYLVPGAGDK